MRARAPSTPSSLVERRVDRDREPDLAAEGDGQRVLELGAQPALELVAGELVGDGDDRGVLVQGQRLARPGARPAGWAAGRRRRSRQTASRSGCGRCSASSPRSTRGLVPPLEPLDSVHTFVHRLCTHVTPCRGRRSRAPVQTCSTSAFAAGQDLVVRSAVTPVDATGAELEQIRVPAGKPGEGRTVTSESRQAAARTFSTGRGRVVTRRPGRAPLRRFDPVRAARVPLGGRPVSTGAACPRQDSGRGCAVPAEACRSGVLREPAGPRPDDLLPPPRKRQLVSKRTYQPNNRRRAQDARLPPAHAHPRRSRASCRSVAARAASAWPSETACRPPCCQRGAPTSTDGPTFRPPPGVAAAPARRPRHAPWRCTWSARPARRPAARVGLVVSKAVGNAVARNQVKRRLRHLVRERLAAAPGLGVLVVRALPAAGRGLVRGAPRRPRPLPG